MKQSQEFADPYVPRRSNRIPIDAAQADGDHWQERISVCEGATTNGEPKLILRSYFKSVKTGERTWDEPPSGASHILYATAADRQAAEDNMAELRLTLDMIPPDAAKSPGSDKKKDKKGFFGRLMHKKETTKTVADSQDLNLQRAIARSMVDEKRKPSSSPNSGMILLYDPEASGNEMNLMSDEETMALAMALSMSDADEQGPVSEEELMQRAMEESRKEAEKQAQKLNGVAAMPPASPPHSFRVPDSPMTPPAAYKNGHGARDSFDDLDRKMPAVDKPSSTGGTIPASPVGIISSSFDPYSPVQDTAVKSSSPSTTELDLNALYLSSSAKPPSPSTLSSPEINNNKSTGRPLSRRIFGGGRKAMEEDAGLV